MDRNKHSTELDNIKVTLRFVIFVVVQAVVLTGGWYTLKNDVSVTHTEVTELTAQVAELKETNKSAIAEQTELKQQVAVLNEQNKQLQNTMYAMIAKIDAQSSNRR